MINSISKQTKKGQQKQQSPLISESGMESMDSKSSLEEAELLESVPLTLLLWSCGPQNR
jgi:hypothetical protein